MVTASSSGNDGEPKNTRRPWWDFWDYEASTKYYWPDQDEVLADIKAALTTTSQKQDS